MKEAFKWLWKYLGKYKFKMSLALLLTIIFTVLNLVNPYLMGIIVDDIIYGGATGILMKILIVMIALTFIKAIIRYIFLMILETISQGVVYTIREDIYKKIQQLDFEFFDKTKTGDIMSRMTGDIEAVRHFVAWVIHNIFFHTITFIFALIMMFKVNAKLTEIMLYLLPLIAYNAYKLSNSVRPTFIDIREQFSKLNSVVQENISGNRVVKAFTKEDYEIQKFEKENQNFKQKNLESAKVWGKYLPVLDSLAVMMSAVMLLVGGLMCIYKQMTIGELVIINGYLWAINNPLRMAGWLINDTQRFFASYDKIKTIISRQPKIKNKKLNTKYEQKIKGTVTFHHVSFKYDNELILDNISFTAHAGQTIAILGPTGSGKTTLVSLICRFYDCDQGFVMIDGIDVRDMNIKELRENIAVAMQDIFLFSDTIEGNIAYGNPRASMREVQWAANIAGVQEFIGKFSDGYDTIIGERGVGLSGGQKQRIALARALLKNPKILILDDTTSSVDMETEFKIHSNLKNVNQHQTTFIIAHRISSVKDTDLILVLDKGRIIEKGNHEELINKKGHYYDVFINQLGDFDQEVVKEVV